MTTLAARRRANIAGWGMSAPFTAILAVFLLLPILASLALSFTSFSIGNIQDWTSAQFVGLDNYTKLFGDDTFVRSLRNTAYFVLVGMPCTIVIGLLLAVALNQGIGKLRGLFRVGFYLPVVTSIVAIAVVWRYMLDPDVGILNAALAQVGITGPDWLGNPNTTMPSIIALGVWRNIGNAMVIFLAALQTVDPQLYEAARVDGAKGRQLFRHVTVPMLRPAILFVTVITTIGYLQVFEEPFVMTGPTGGAGPVRPDDLAVRLPAGLPLLQPGLRERGGVHAVRLHRGPGHRPVPRPEDQVMTVLDVRGRAHQGPQAQVARGQGPRAVVAVRPAGARDGPDGRAVRVDAARRVQDQRRLRPHDADAAARDAGRWTTSAACSPSRTSSATSSTAPGSRSWSRPPTCCSAAWPATRWPS